MPKNERTISTQQRFDIINRDDFTCLFCAARPGNDRLHVDHFIPWSFGGSDHPFNLGTTCDRCNAGKAARIHIPKSRCDGFIDGKGWTTWKRWGDWHLQFTPLAKESEWDPMESPMVDTSAYCALTFEPPGSGPATLDYWIAIDRVHENDWEEHLRGKPWLLEEDTEYEAALEVARAEVVGDRRWTISMTENDQIEAIARKRMGRRPRRESPNEQYRHLLDALRFARTVFRKVRSG